MDDTCRESRCVWESFVGYCWRHLGGLHILFSIVNYLVTSFNIPATYGIHPFMYTRRKALLTLLGVMSASLLIGLRALIDMTVVDYYFAKNRFKVIYQLLRFDRATRLWVYVSLPSRVPVFHISISQLFINAVWLERECWDLFGMFFIGNQSLRRIMTDYGFKGFPLRKDFPLTGYVELYYNPAYLMIIYAPVSLSQELRFFNFNSPWEGQPRW